jgi:hypothetical protein
MICVVGSNSLATAAGLRADTNDLDHLLAELRRILRS